MFVGPWPHAPIGGPRAGSGDLQSRDPRTDRGPLPAARTHGPRPPCRRVRHRRPSRQGARWAQQAASLRGQRAASVLAAGAKEPIGLGMNDRLVARVTLQSEDLELVAVNLWVLLCGIIYMLCLSIEISLHDSTTVLIGLCDLISAADPSHPCQCIVEVVGGAAWPAERTTTKFKMCCSSSPMCVGLRAEFFCCRCYC